MSNIHNNIPSRWSMMVFIVKSNVLKAKRGINNIFGKDFTKYPPTPQPDSRDIVAKSITPLWTNKSEDEFMLTAGKVQNLRIALKQLNGVEIPANALFSFWAQVGRPTQWKGYVDGRELREGCIIPTIGGGLCQLSNALYDAALQANFEIIERHAHTKVIPGSLAEVGRDATIFWNYVDLRFRSETTFRIEAYLNRDSLVVQFRGEKNKEIVIPVENKIQKAHDLNNCYTCNAHDCDRHVNNAKKSTGATAFLLDEYWPEYDRFIKSKVQSEDYLFIPLNGQKFNKPNYKWNQEGVKKVYTETFRTFHRAFQMRNLPSQGGALQSTLLKFDKILADAYAQKIKPEVSHLYVTQNLLPFLWQSGALGGRTFDVFMTRLPMGVLQQRLDAAFKKHSCSKTLNDFRVEDNIARAEEEALKNARFIITPHTEIAKLFPGKVILLDWEMPVRSAQRNENGKIFFPAAALGRKGAYEVRNVAKELKLELIILGKDLESENFWQGIKTEKADTEWMKKTSAVVLPSYIDHKPRKLLEAIAYGIPVITSTASGLEHVKGVISIPPGDEQALKKAIEKVLFPKDSFVINP
ncbi:MAG: VanW family protein [Cytophagaceae bacterium]|nr:VanW family protein [Cytophagaceae bacterium]